MAARNPTSSAIDEQAQALADNGFVVIENVLSDVELTQLRELLGPYLRGELLGRNDFEGFQTERVYALLAKSASFAEIIDHPRVTPIVERFLEPSYLLWASLAINLLPGESCQRLHRDNLGGPGASSEIVHGISTMWAIDEFTTDNGATLLVPGSHRWPGDEVLTAREDEAVPMTMAPGSVLVWQGATAHAGGANHTAASRLGITIQYCQPWLRPLESFLLSVPPDQVRELPERIQEMLGYSLREPGIMGYVDGMHPKRLLNSDYAGRRARGVPS